jgi:hypothetical protein
MLQIEVSFVVYRVVCGDSVTKKNAKIRRKQSTRIMKTWRRRQVQGAGPGGPVAVFWGRGP